MNRAALGPLALLLAYGAAFGSAALGRGLLVYDDHPGQLYRLWHAVTLGFAPWRWNPGWWAGYAELQYYPPGLSYAGAGLHAVALGALSVEGAYRVLLWVALLLPALSTYWLVYQALGRAGWQALGRAGWQALGRAGWQALGRDGGQALGRDGGQAVGRAGWAADRGWLALPPAFLALVISSETRSGLEEGVRWGLVAARVGWGLLPALGALLLGWLDGAPRPGLGAPLLLAAVILVHPAHAPMACAMVLLAAALAAGPAETRARTAAVVLGLGFGLSAFWLLPLLAHLSIALPLAWGDASLRRLAQRSLDYPVLALLIGGTAAGWWWHLRRAPAERATAWLLSLAPVAVGLVMADSLLGALRVHWLPVDRVADSLVLAAILGASVALAAAARVAPWLPAWALSAAAIALTVALSSGRHEPGLSLWPLVRQWPTEAEVTRGARLDDLWRAVRAAPPGRILFVRSGVPLEYSPEWWRPHSHITALTPIETGREIIGGTFTHPSPVAGFFYSGSPVAPITLLAEQRDGVTLFGAPLAALRPAQLERIATALRVSAVIALDEDEPRLGVLGPATGFAEPRRIGPFLYYAALAPQPLPEAIGAGRLLVVAAGAASSSWRETGVAYSPLWSARIGDGRALTTRRGVTGILEVESPPGAGGPVELIYRPGAAEWAGAAVSAAAAAALVLSAWRRRPQNR